MAPDIEANVQNLRQELDKTESFTHVVFNQVPYVVFVYEVLEDGEFRALRMNQTGSLLTGLPVSHWPGKTPEQIHEPQDAADIRVRLEAAVEQGTAYFEEELDFPNGKVWTQSIYSAITNKDGRIYRVVGTALDITEQKKRDMEELRKREQIITSQMQALTELSTPLLAISDQVVVMPLVGTIDTNRAQRIMEALLTGISAAQASVAILDITGVPIVDTQVANTLISAAQAVNLLGTKVALTGIRPEIAQTLVGLSVNLRGIVTYSTLQAGIAYALRSSEQATK